MNKELKGKEVYEGIADLLKKFGGVSEVHECRIPDDQYEELLKCELLGERYIHKLRREFPHISFIRAGKASLITKDPHHDRRTI